MGAVQKLSVLGLLEIVNFFGRGHGHIRFEIVVVVGAWNVCISWPDSGHLSWSRPGHRYDLVRNSVEQVEVLHYYRDRDRRGLDPLPSGGSCTDRDWLVCGLEKILDGAGGVLRSGMGRCCCSLCWRHWYYLWRGNSYASKGNYLDLMVSAHSRTVYEREMVRFFLSSDNTRFCLPLGRRRCRRVQVSRNLPDEEGHVESRWDLDMKGMW